jgi:hypothetical protein
MAFCYRVRIKLLHVSNSQSDVIVELEAWRATKKVVFTLKLDGPDVTVNVSRQAPRSVGRKAWVSLVCVEASPHRAVNAGPRCV